MASKAICSVVDCSNPHKAKGLCNKHYRRQLPKSNNRDLIKCKGCLQMFQPKHAARTCCSRACGAMIRGKRPLAILKAAESRIDRKLKAQRKGPKPPPSPEQVELQRQARREWYAVRRAKMFKSQQRVCSECGRKWETSLTNRRKKYCSNACARRSLRRTGKQLRKARQRGVGAESFDPLSVLKRDGWCCQICGIKTPRSLRGTLDDRAPELDHILPLSRGGEHSRRNTQCACRGCNISKGNGAANDQLILIG